MPKKYIIAGTDTGIGKTVFSAMLTLALDGEYWKPVQSGIEDTVDAKRVQELTALPADRFLPESYVLSEALSPHRAAELDRIKIDVSRITPPPAQRTLIIEGAGGLMVPYTRNKLQVNIFREWNIPVILCARSGLGTINHTLLSVEALWARNIPIHGIAFIGEENRDNMKTVAQFSGEKILGRLPMLPDLSAKSLQKAFDVNFKKADFE